MKNRPKRARYERDDPDNPWSAAGWSKARQDRMCQISITEARRMAAAAGSSLDATEPPDPSAPSE